MSWNSPRGTPLVFSPRLAEQIRRWKALTDVYGNIFPGTGIPEWLIREGELLVLLRDEELSRMAQ